MSFKSMIQNMIKISHKAKINSLHDIKNTFDVPIEHFRAEYTFDTYDLSDQWYTIIEEDGYETCIKGLTGRRRYRDAPSPVFFIQFSWESSNCATHIQNALSFEKSAPFLLCFTRTFRKKLMCEYSNELKRT
jgi:hypothetical protein